MLIAQPISKESQVAAGILKLSRVGSTGPEDFAGLMIELLIALRSQGTSHRCWGYSFPGRREQSCRQVHCGIDDPASSNFCSS
jgi:hypothetical protein